jgi:hypothetical protein
MPPSQRLELALETTREYTLRLLAGPPDVVARRFELIRQENDARNLNMLTAIARTKSIDDGPDASPG